MSEAEQSPTRRSGRRPGNSGSRAAILEAARTRFAEEGFAAATLRKIAADAGVDPALIIRFYGSKDHLFEASMHVPLAITEHLEAAFDGDPSAVGERLVRAYFTPFEDPELALALQTTFRSAMINEQAAAQLREFLAARILSAIPATWSVKDAPERVALAAAQLLGVALARNILKTAALTSLDTDALVTFLGPSIQATLDPRS